MGGWLLVGPLYCAPLSQLATAYWIFWQFFVVFFYNSWTAEKILFWLCQELKKCKFFFVRSFICLSDEKFSRAHNIHLISHQVSLRSVSDQSQVSLSSVSGQSQVSLRSVSVLSVLTLSDRTSLKYFVLLHYTPNIAKVNALLRLE